MGLNITVILLSFFIFTSQNTLAQDCSLCSEAIVTCCCFQTQALTCPNKSCKKVYHKNCIKKILISSFLREEIRTLKCKRRNCKQVLAEIICNAMTEKTRLSSLRIKVNFIRKKKTTTS